MNESSLYWIICVIVFRQKTMMLCLFAFFCLACCCCNALPQSTLSTMTPSPMMPSPMTPATTTPTTGSSTANAAAQGQASANITPGTSPSSPLSPPPFSPPPVLQPSNGPFSPPPFGPSPSFSPTGTGSATAFASASASASVTIQTPNLQQLVSYPTDVQQCSSLYTMRYQQTELMKLNSKSFYVYQASRAQQQISFDSAQCTDFFVSQGCQTIKIVYHVSTSYEVTKTIWAADTQGNVVCIKMNVKVVSDQYMVLQDSFMDAQKVMPGSTSAVASTQYEQLQQYISSSQYVALYSDYEHLMVMKRCSDTASFIAVSESLYLNQQQLQTNAMSAIQAVASFNQIDVSSFSTLTQQFSIDITQININSSSNNLMNPPTSPFSSPSSPFSSPSSPFSSPSSPFSPNPSGSSASASAEAQAQAHASGNITPGISPSPLSPLSPPSPFGPPSPFSPSSPFSPPSVIPSPSSPFSPPSGSGSTSAFASASASATATVSLQSPNLQQVTAYPTEVQQCASVYAMKYQQADLMKLNQKIFYVHQASKSTKQITFDSAQCFDFLVSQSCQTIRIQYTVSSSYEVTKVMWGASSTGDLAYIKTSVKFMSQQYAVMEDTFMDAQKVQSGSTTAVVSSQTEQLKEYISASAYVLSWTDYENVLVMKRCTDSVVFIAVSDSLYQNQQQIQSTAMTAIQAIASFHQFDLTSFSTLTQMFSMDITQISITSSSFSVNKNSDGSITSGNVMEHESAGAHMTGSTSVTKGPTGQISMSTSTQATTSASTSPPPPYSSPSSPTPSVGASATADAHASASAGASTSPPPP